MRRLLETFFRRRWLYLVPVILFSLVGMAKAATSNSGYQSVGVIDVSNGTLLSQLTSVRGQTFGFESPATTTARTMNSVLRTDNFMESVIKEAGVTQAIKTGQLTALGLRQALSASADGDTLVQVVATTDNPELSAKLAKATIDSFIQYTVAGDVSESKAAEDFLQEQLTAYKSSVDKAQQALNDYATTHPGGPQAERPLGEQLQISTLQKAVDEAQSQYTAIQQKADEARLASEQAASDAAQRLRIIDEPSVSTAPEPRLKKSIFSFVIFFFVGMMLSVGAVVLATVLDRSLRTPDDVEHLLGLEVLAVVPDTRQGDRRRRGARSQRHDKVDAATPERDPDGQEGRRRAVSCAGDDLAAELAPGARHDCDGEVMTNPISMSDHDLDLDELTPGGSTPTLARSARRTPTGRAVRPENGAIAVRAETSVARVSETSPRRAVDDAPVDVVETGAPAAVDAVRYLLASLQHQEDDCVMPARLGFTSALAGEGVTYVARTVGAVLAHDSRERVCIVDLNWESPATSKDDAPRKRRRSKARHESDDRPSVPGLADALRRETPLREIILATDDPRLTIVAAGVAAPSEAQVFARSERLARIIDTLARHNDRLILDLPPVLASSAAIPLARLADAVALVVRQGVTTDAQVRTTLERLGQIPSAGVVLNMASSKIPRRLLRRLVELVGGGREGPHRLPARRDDRQRVGDPAGPAAACAATRRLQPAGRGDAVHHQSVRLT